MHKKPIDEAETLTKLIANPGAKFAIPLTDGSWVLGQVLDWMNSHILRCVVYGPRHLTSELALEAEPQRATAIGRAAILKTDLKAKRWPLGGIAKLHLPSNLWPNESTRTAGWVGAKVYDSALLEDFVNAFYGLSYWDDWYDPNYLDGFLFDPSDRPHNLIFKSRA